MFVETVREVLNSLYGNFSGVIALQCIILEDIPTVNTEGQNVRHALPLSEGFYQQ